MQVSPSFFDSPASHMATFMQAARDRTARPVRPELVTVVFCSPAKPVGASPFGPSSGTDKIAGLNQFRSCVRTCLLLLGGVEAQEREGKSDFLVCRAIISMESTLIRMNVLLAPHGAGGWSVCHAHYRFASDLCCVCHLFHEGSQC